MVSVGCCVDVSLSAVVLCRLTNRLVRRQCFVRSPRCEATGPPATSPRRTQAAAAREARHRVLVETLQPQDEELQQSAGPVDSLTGADQARGVHAHTACRRIGSS